MKKNIYLNTTNNNKLLEFQKFFDNYGIPVTKINIPIKEISDFLNSLDHSTTKHFLLKERTLLLNNSNPFDYQDMDIVENHSTLYVYSHEKPSDTLTADTIKGYLNLSKKTSKNTFGWDDIFILPEIGLSLFEMNEKGFKVSARQNVLSLFAKEFLYYEKRIDLNFNPQNQSKTIDFSNVVNFVNSNKLLNLPLVKDSIISPIIQKALEKGAFFRSAENRREKNYWLPGLNSGIPLVPKRDEIHELTFNVHDFSHFVMPDLICVGPNDQFHKNVYVIYRMLSEAFTLVFADMLFVSKLKESKIDYDYSKRNILPLFEDILDNNPDFSEIANPKTNQDFINLKRLLFANAEYCLSGNDSSYVKLLGGNTPSLDKFKGKYQSFFCEDFKWTNLNYENMINKGEVLSNWAKYFETELLEQKLYTIEQFVSVAELDHNSTHKQLTRDISNYVLDKYFLADNTSNIDPIESSKKAFVLGQSVMFFEFQSVQRNMSHLIKKVKSQINSNIDIDGVNNLFKIYLEGLYNKNVIDSDQLSVYQEVFPLFSPTYVFYDKDKDYYKSIGEVANSIFKS